MKQQAISYIGVLLCGILFPYIVTMMISGRILPHSGLGGSGRYVILQSTGAQMDAEEFLIGAAAAQIPASFHEEAIKAQVLLARTMLYRSMAGQNTVQQAETGMNFWSIAEMEKYWGQDQFLEYYTKIEEAVKATRGETVQYNGEYIVPFFHTLSSGQTRADRTGQYPYLVSREALQDMGAEQYFMETLWSEEDFASRLAERSGKEFTHEAILSSIQVIEKEETGYIIRIQIGGCEFTAEEIARAFDLPSCAFLFREDQGKIRIVCRGAGSGYGMSQWCASCMGEAGNSYSDILKYFFQNITICAE